MSSLAWATHPLPGERAGMECWTSLDGRLDAKGADAPQRRA